MVLVCVLLVPYDPALTFDTARSELQSAFKYDWIPSFQIDYFMALDGISLPLVMLTTLVSFLAMWASWPITKYVKAYCILFLLLETGMVGVFLALDFFLFYVFWEVMLLPMYFLIGIWGGPRKEYAAIKFFLYTLLGSVLMLIAILMLYFNSNLADPALLAVDPNTGDSHLARAHLSPAVLTRAQAELAAIEAGTSQVGRRPVHTSNILALQQIGQHSTQLSRPIQWWCFLLLFIGFAIKVPAVPVHTW